MPTFSKHWSPHAEGEDNEEEWTSPEEFRANIGNFGKLFEHQQRTAPHKVADIRREHALKRLRKAARHHFG